MHQFILTNMYIPPGKENDSLLKDSFYFFKSIQIQANNIIAVDDLNATISNHTVRLFTDDEREEAWNILRVSFPLGLTVNKRGSLLLELCRPLDAIIANARIETDIPGSSDP